MMIVGVTTVLDEAPIIKATITHLFGEGIDHVIVTDGGSTDGTQAVLDSIPNVTWTPQHIPEFHQDLEMSWLAHQAADLGADWIIPFDADEFWYDPLGGTIRSILEGVAPEIAKIHTATWQHVDWDTKLVAQKMFGKVAIRPVPPFRLNWGNHDAEQGDPDNPPLAEHGLLAIRELQYRDYDHFIDKIRKAADLYASWHVPEVHGGHMRALVGLTGQALEDAYNQVQAGERMYDPIPFKGER
jgi:glycosyltransferase involved in cell wall biosynthesis